MNLTDKYLGEASSAMKSEFYAWLRERDKKEMTCTIVEGGMVLAVCKGKIQVKGGSIPEFSVHGKSSNINFIYATFKASPVKIMGKDGWHLSVKGNLTYEVY